MNTTMTSPTWFDPKMTVGNLIVILTLLASVISGWVTFDARISLLERAVDRVETKSISDNVQRGDLTARVIRIEERLIAQQDVLQEIRKNTGTR